MKSNSDKFDPDACLETVLDAWSSEDLETMGSAANDLREWLDNDGDAPNVAPHQLYALLVIACHHAGFFD